MWIMVLVGGKLDRNISTVCAFKDLKCIFEGCGPVMVFKDKVLQVLHDVLVETNITVHLVFEGKTGVIYI